MDRDKLRLCHARWVVCQNENYNYSPIKTKNGSVAVIFVTLRFLLAENSLVWHTFKSTVNVKVDM